VPAQIVINLANEEIYIASESTIHRILKDENKVPIGKHLEIIIKELVY